MLKKYARLYKSFTIQYLKILMQSKVNFFIGLFGFFCLQATGIAFIYLIFQRIPSLNGWNLDEVAFIYGFSQLPRGLDHLITDFIWIFSQNIIVRGEFDRYLLRPINPLFQLIVERFQPDGFGEILIGLILVVISNSHLHMKFGFLDILLFTVVVISGSVIYTSIKLFFASFAFWIKSSISILDMIYSLSDFAKYPIGIYSRVIQVIITFIIPFAFTAFIPAGYFIGKVPVKLAVFGTVLASILSFTMAYTVFQKGINSYESAGN